MASGRRWQRDELVLALDLYCRTPFGKLHRLNPEIIGLAKAIGRTPDALAMKCCNFASLDPAEQARGVRGLSGAAEADGQVFAELAHNIDALDRARAAAASKLRVHDPAAATVEPVVDPLEAAAERLAKRGASLGGEAPTVIRRARRLQGLFRQIVLVSYESSCAVCSLQVQQLLDAAHIAPWSGDAARQLDPANGVLLCCLHHRAFDVGLIAVDTAGKILVSPRARAKTPAPFHKIALDQIEGEPLRLPRRFQPAPDAWAAHRLNVFQAA